LAILLSKLKHLETIRAVATNIGVVPETEAACQIVLHGCPLVSPPAVQYGALTDAAHKNDQNASKTPDDFLTTKNNPYFKGQFHMTRVTFPFECDSGNPGERLCRKDRQYSTSKWRKLI